MRVSSRNEEQRPAAPMESNHFSSRSQNGESDIQYVKATEVSSMPESKRRDPIQVCTAAWANRLVLKIFLIFWIILAQAIHVRNRFYKN